MKKVALFIMCLSSIFLIDALQISFADIIPADRRIDWSQAGVTGGIPNRTTVCSTLNPGATAAQINSAINNCPSGQVVFLNAGTYSLASQIRIQKNNVTLRGAGPGKTILNLTSPLTGSFGGGSLIWLGVDNWQAIFSDNLPVVNIHSGANKDSTGITVSNASGIAPGDLLIIDELNDSSVTYVLAPSYLSRQQGTRARGQMVEVTGVSGNTITFKDPLYRTLTMSLAPQAVLINSGIVTKLSGIEDMTLTQSGPNTNEYRGAMIAFDAAHNCWVKNVEVANIVSIGIEVMAGLHTEIRDSYIHDSSIDACCGWIPLSVKGRFGNSYGYAVLLSWYNSGGLVVNNILKNVGPGFEMIGPTSGNVVAYNYAHTILYNNGADNFLGTDQGSHGSFPMFNLYESNIGYKIGIDNTNGGASSSTFFREYSKGYIGDAIYHASVAAMFNAGNIHMNAIGNVLGTPGKSNLYQSSDGNDFYQGPPPNAVYPVWHLGFWDGSHAPDPLVGATLLRWGNFDYATNAARWDPAEVPSAYGVPVPSDHVLPASLLLSGRPSWFTTPWGTPAWPAIGPDVTGGNSDSAGHVYKIPAQLCYENTIGQGLAFAPTTCYASAAAVLYGDVSENGSVTAYDASLAAQYGVGLITLTSSQLIKADVSGNGSTTSFDASLIAQYAVGIITRFPVQG